MKMCHDCHYNNSDATFCLLMSDDINLDRLLIRLLVRSIASWWMPEALKKVITKTVQQTGNPCVTSIAFRTWCTPKTLTLYASMRHGWTKISATLKYRILALQYLGKIGLIKAAVEFLSQSKQPPSKLSKDLNLDRRPSCNSLRSFLPKLLRLLVKEIYSVFAMGHPMQTQVGWMYSIIFCMKFVTSSTIW